MQVDLANLEPGSVVVTPEVLAKQTENSQIIYTGMLNAQPIFHQPTRGGDWDVINWPHFSDGYKLAPAPFPGFEVVRNDQLIKQFVAAWPKIGTTYSSGCDPEIFVMDGKGKVIPARSVLPEKGTDHQLFYDGLQAEFTPLPGGCLEGLASRIRYLLNEIRLQFTSKDPRAKLSVQNSIQLTQEEISRLADEDVAFRCSESMNIYNDIPGVQEPREYLHRFAGGHIHVGAHGYGVLPTHILCRMVRAMDGVLGVASVSLARSFDSPERRKNYGRAGEFRLPKHGLEYRVLSNFWLCSPLMYHLVFEIARWGYRLGASGMFQAAWEGSEEETRECINNCDVSLAEKIISRNAGIYQKLFQERWKYQNNPGFLIKKAMDTIMNGLETVVEDPAAIEKNWSLGNNEWGLYGEIPNGKWRQLKCS